MAKRTGERARQKRERWAHEIARWQRSGESVRAFCRRRGLKEPSFYYWRRRIEAEPAMDVEASVGLEASTTPSMSADSSGSVTGSSSTESKIQGPAFAELRVSGEPGASGAMVELTLPTGEQLRIGDEVSSEHLQRVLTAVREVHGC